MLKFEFAVTAKPGRIDEKAGILYGCSVVTAGVEAKGHGIWTDQKLLQQVKASADTYAGGVKVKADHGSGFAGIVGLIKNFRISGDRLLGDIHLFDIPSRAQIVELAKAAPESFGLSIAFNLTKETIGDKVFARCSEIYSIDLVDRPAANPGGLFSEVSLDIIQQHAAIKDPVSRTLFYRQNKAAYDLAFRERDRLAEEAKFQEHQQWATERFFSDFPDPNCRQRKFLQNLESKNKSLL